MHRHKWSGSSINGPTYADHAFMTNINGPHLTNRHSFVKFITVDSSTVAICTRELVSYEFFSERDSYMYYKIEAY